MTKSYPNPIGLISVVSDCCSKWLVVSHVAGVESLLCTVPDTSAHYKGKLNDNKNNLKTVVFHNCAYMLLLKLYMQLFSWMKNYLGNIVNTHKSTSLQPARSTTIFLLAKTSTESHFNLIPFSKY